MAAPTTTPLEDFFDSADLRLPSAKDEARALFGLVERGSSTAEAVRELIDVPEVDAQRLRRIAEAEPEVAHCVLPVLRFRRRVLREFERMIGAHAAKVAENVQPVAQNRPGYRQAIELSVLEEAGAIGNQSRAPRL